MRVIFLGPPGSGKGMCANEVAPRLEVVHFSTGDYLRGKKKEKDPRIMALEERFSEKCILIPDEEINKIVFDRMEEPSFSKGYILDRFPRTIAQANALEQFKPTDHVFYFDILPETIAERMKNRLLCSNSGSCNAVYNLKTIQPEKEGLCDKCGSSLYQRVNDSDISKIKTRLEEYEKKTAPLIEFYKKHESFIGIKGFYTINANPEPDKVISTIERILIKEKV